MNLPGTRVVITGGASGLGLRIAHVMAEAGAQVLVSDVNDDALAAAAATGLLTARCDVSDEAQVETLMKSAAERLGGIDILVNNAGVAGPTGPVETLDSAQWRSTFDVNVHGPYYCVKHSLSFLRKSENPRIINLASAAGRLGFAGRSPYSASKWAVVGFTKTLAIELGADGIPVNAICPGAVDGPRIQAVIDAKAQMLHTSRDEVAALYENQSSLGRLISPDDIAATALFLAGPGGRAISGQALAVDGNTEKLY